MTGQTAPSRPTGTSRAAPAPPPRHARAQAPRQDAGQWTAGAE